MAVRVGETCCDENPLSDAANQISVCATRTQGVTKKRPCQISLCHDLLEM
jgi:hypothetical protein